MTDSRSGISEMIKRTVPEIAFKVGPNVPSDTFQQIDTKLQIVSNFDSYKSFLVMLNLMLSCLKSSRGVSPTERCSRYNTQLKEECLKWLHGRLIIRFLSRTYILRKSFRVPWVQRFGYFVLSCLMAIMKERWCSVSLVPWGWQR